MGKNRYFNSDFWTDSWVVDDLDTLEQHMFIYLFTNPQANLAGVYRISTRVISFATKIEHERVLAIFEKLKPKVEYVDGWVIMRNSIKNQNYHNAKIKAGILAILETLPDTILQHVTLPKDFGQIPEKKPEQTKLVDDSSMTDTRPIHDTSHANSNSNSNSNTAVPAVNSGKTRSVAHAPKTATTGSNSFRTRRAEADALYADLHGLVNDEFRDWYLGQFMRLGRDRVMILASQAKVDGRDSPKLFSSMLRDETGSQPVPQGQTASLGDIVGRRT